MRLITLLRVWLGCNMTWYKDLGIPRRLERSGRACLKAAVGVDTR